MLAAIVNELFIDLVGDDVELLFHGEGGDLLERFARDHAAVGVAGAVEDQRLGLVRDALFDLLGANDEAVLVMAGHEHRHAAHHFHHFRVADPVGRGDEHLVAVVDEHAQRRKERLLGAAGDDDLRNIVGKAVVLEEFLRDGLAQGERARYGRIARPALVDGAMRRRADVFGRIKIRLARAEADHVLALGLERLGARIDGQRGRRGDLRRPA